MKHANHVVTNTALGIVTNSYHPHWAECNPLKRQGLTKEERHNEAHKYDFRIAQEKKRHELILKLYPKSRILYSDGIKR